MKRGTQFRKKWQERNTSIARWTRHDGPQAPNVDTQNANTLAVTALKRVSGA